MQMTHEQLEKSFYHECIMYSGLGVEKQRELLEKAHADKKAALADDETAIKLFGITVRRRSSRPNERAH